MGDPSTQHEMPEPVEVTAHHMADAISFLMRVASEAGLRSIALKLANVRASLLTVKFRDIEPMRHDQTGEAPDPLDGDEELDGRRKSH